MLVFVGASFAADKVVDAKIKVSKVEKTKETKISPSAINSCKVVIEGGRNRGSWYVSCDCSQAEACSRAYATMLMFIS